MTARSGIDLHEDPTSWASPHQGDAVRKDGESRLARSHGDRRPEVRSPRARDSLVALVALEPLDSLRSLDRLTLQASWPLLVPRDSRLTGGANASRTAPNGLGLTARAGCLHNP